MARKNETYNGSKNYETWNVSLWINNDEPLYRSACAFMRRYHGRAPYRDFVEAASLERTMDGVSFTDGTLGLAELNAMMRELAN